jgi:hypothetical protein
MSSLLGTFFLRMSFCSSSSTGWNSWKLEIFCQLDEELPLAHKAGGNLTPRNPHDDGIVTQTQGCFFDPWIRIDRQRDQQRWKLLSETTYLKSFEPILEKDFARDDLLTPFGLDELLQLREQTRESPCGLGASSRHLHCVPKMLLKQRECAESESGHRVEWRTILKN